MLTRKSIRFTLAFALAVAAASSLAYRAVNAVNVAHAVCTAKIVDHFGRGTTVRYTTTQVSDIGNHEKQVQGTGKLVARGQYWNTDFQYWAKVDVRNGKTRDVNFVTHGYSQTPPRGVHSPGRIPDSNRTNDMHHFDSTQAGTGTLQETHLRDRKVTKLRVQLRPGGGLNVIIEAPQKYSFTGRWYNYSSNGVSIQVTNGLDASDIRSSGRVTFDKRGRAFTHVDFNGKFKNRTVSLVFDAK